MKKHFYVLTLALVVASTLATSTSAQTTRGAATSPANAQAATALLATLPASDAVMLVDVRRLLTEALPRVHNNPAELARVNAEIDQFKARTGLDARSFERLAVGVSYARTENGKTLVETVAIARGTFNPAALVGAARIASKDKLQEQKYAGKTIHVFSVNDQVKLLGMFNLRVTDVAVAALDAHTLAIGKLERVRAAIDASAGRGRVSPEIAALATRDANAIIGLGGNVPQSLTQNLNVGNEAISKSIASVRQFYSALGTTAGGFNLLTVLRTETASAAQTLSTTIAGLKQIAPIFIGQMRPERARPLQGLVDNTKVSTQGNDVQITLELAQADVAAMMAAF